MQQPQSFHNLTRVPQTLCGLRRNLDAGASESVRKCHCELGSQDRFTSVESGDAAPCPVLRGEHDRDYPSAIGRDDAGRRT